MPRGHTAGIWRGRYAPRTKEREALPEGRKLVTILFADITGSTALGEALDPEDVRALMGHYYQHAHEIIPAHGGTLEKFIGDAVMAVFGLPTAHGDDAERALAAALALRAAIADDASLAAAREALAQVRPGDPLGTLGEVVDFAPFAAYLGGHWDELETYRQLLAQSVDEGEYDSNR